MTSPNANHCTFSAIVEVSDTPRLLYGSTISFPATLQGPPHTSIPDLHILEFIPIEIEYYGDKDLTFDPTSIVFCAGTVSSKEHVSGSMPTINITAYHLNICPGDPFTTTYIDTVRPAMMNANLDIVGVINSAVEKRGDHRLFSVHTSTYAGKDPTDLKYDHFDVCCILNPDPLRLMETGRTAAEAPSPNPRYPLRSYLLPQIILAA
ncbi:hypothetical protein V8E54_005374 [Elaphomyces granulatus]